LRASSTKAFNNARAYLASRVSKLEAALRPPTPHVSRTDVPQYLGMPGGMGRHPVGRTGGGGVPKLGTGDSASTADAAGGRLHQADSSAQCHRQRIGQARVTQNSDVKYEIHQNRTAIRKDERIVARVRPAISSTSHGQRDAKLMRFHRRRTDRSLQHLRNLRYPDLLLGKRFHLSQFG
jgi:hypothetical protein